MILGDFNCPEISWLSGNVIGPSNSVNKNIVLQQNFLDIVQNNGLSWIITYEVTCRRTVGNVVQESTIDQIFCTDESLISKFQINQPLGKSDHVSIVIDLNLFQPDKNTVMTLIIFKENGPRWNLKSSLKCHMK